jgi:hypothetical protein
MWSRVAILAVGVALTACGTGERSTTTTTTIPATGGQQVVIGEPAAGVARGEVRHRVTGRVADIERNHGEVTVRSSDGGKVKLTLPPMAVATMREGDDVADDVVVTPRR